MARKRKQSILKRDASGNVVYDGCGKPVVERCVTASRAHFKSAKSTASRQCATRAMTEDECKLYGLPATSLSAEDRKRIGLAALSMTEDERRRHGY